MQKINEDWSNLWDEFDIEVSKRNLREVYTNYKLVDANNKVIKDTYGDSIKQSLQDLKIIDGADRVIKYYTPEIEDDYDEQGSFKSSSYEIAYKDQSGRVIINKLNISDEDWPFIPKEYKEELSGDSLMEGPSGQTSAKKVAFDGLAKSQGFSPIDEILHTCAKAQLPDANFPDYVVIHHLNGQHSDNSIGNRVLTASHWHNLLGIKMAQPGDPEEVIFACINRIISIVRKNHIKLYDYEEACRGNLVELAMGGWETVDDPAGGGYMAHDHLLSALCRAFKVDQRHYK